MIPVTFRDMGLNFNIFDILEQFANPPINFQVTDPQLGINILNCLYDSLPLFLQACYPCIFFLIKQVHTLPILDIPTTLLTIPEVYLPYLPKRAHKRINPLLYACPCHELLLVILDGVEYATVSFVYILDYLRE